MDVQKTIENLGINAKEIVQENKGAAAGAVLGYVLSETNKTQTAIIGAIAGHLLIDKQKEG